jgi:inorganic pyrophosphatase
VLGERVRVRIEVPRGGRIKRRPTGAIELVSPLGCPFDYGSIVGRAGADGDAADAVLLGPRRRRGDDVEAVVRGVVRFLDGGVEDDKWICGEPPTAGDRRRITWFFRVWGVLKRVRHPLRRSGVVRVEWDS